MINPKDPSVNPIQSVGATKVDASHTANANKSGQQHSQHSSPKAQPEKATPSPKPVVENPDAKQPTHSPQQQGAVGINGYSGKWDQYIGSAKTTWGKLTDDELMKSEGNIQKLSGLVAQRYALSKEIAETQVKKFLGSCCSK